jgi:hypothetical protein
VNFRAWVVVTPLGEVMPATVRIHQSGAWNAAWKIATAGDGKPRALPSYPELRREMMRAKYVIRRANVTVLTET